MQHNIVNSPLPPCKQSILKDFLNSKNWVFSESLSDEDVEIWIDSTGLNHVEIYKELEPIPYHIISIILERQMSVGISAMPFYAKHIAQRFPEA